MPNEREREIEDAVELLDQMLDAADGGHEVGPLDSYRASTVLALLMDAEYRRAVMARLSDFDHVRAE